MNLVLNATTVEKFQKIVIEHYAAQGRYSLPWRVPEPDGSFDPYKIMVSEVMLQQTQVPRVIEKYQLFLKNFPTVQTLADSSLADVLTVWSGLGYYRRARYLKESAQRIVNEFAGTYPQTVPELATLQGIGKNTAAAILVYSYSLPLVFIETNIRSVYLHHFFHDQELVGDSEILPFVERTLDTSNPREWYWALMDYGSYLKRQIGNPSTRSKHYAKQSPFLGSLRQIRGQVLKELAVQPHTLLSLKQSISDERLTTALNELLTDGLISKNDNTYHLGK